MNSASDGSGGFSGGLGVASLDPPAGAAACFDSVEERLVEAFATLSLLPDRERGWLKTRTMGLWREVVRDRVDIDCEPTPGRPGVGRVQHARMEEALGWCAWVRADQRRLIGRVMLRLVDGREVDWPGIRRDLGEVRTTEALRKAYGRALNSICSRLNRSRGLYF